MSHSSVRTGPGRPRRSWLSVVLSPRNRVKYCSWASRSRTWILTKSFLSVSVRCRKAAASFPICRSLFLQYFADDMQLAAMVFWTFGDAARANWHEIALMAVVTVMAAVYFQANSWNYNAIDAGDETARGLGVRVERVRLLGMLTASLVTAILVAFLGIIGFVGLVCPHMIRRLIGSDMRFLLPGSMVCGALLLLASDTVARLILTPRVLPVSVLTAFLGAPVFIFLIIRGYGK